MEVAQGRAGDSRCSEYVGSGGPCVYPASRCPLHAVRGSVIGRPAAQFEVESAAAAPEPIRINALMARHVATSESDPRRLAAEVLKRVVDGTAGPLQATRFLRASRLLTAMGQAEMENEAALAEAEFRGRLMHGMPPRTDEEWEYARMIFDEDTVNEFARWAVTFDAPFPADLNPPGGRTRREQRETKQALERSLAEKDAAWQGRSEGWPSQ